MHAQEAQHGQHTWMPMRMRCIADADAIHCGWGCRCHLPYVELTWMRHICLLLQFLGWPLRGRAKQTSACFRFPPWGFDMDERCNCSDYLRYRGYPPTKIW